MRIRLIAIFLAATSAACAVTAANPAPLDVEPTNLDAYWVVIPDQIKPGGNEPLYSCATATIVISGTGRVTDGVLDRIVPDTSTSRKAALAYFLSQAYGPSASNNLRRPVRVRASVISVLTNEDGSPLDLELVRGQCNI
jgi:hypothetical protein